MKYLVTGGSGFVGAHLTRRLLQRGEDVHVLSRPGAEAARLEQIASAGAGQLHVHRIGADLNSIRQLFDEVVPESVLHLASLNISQHRPEQIEDLVRSNILLPALLFDCFAEIGGSRVVNMGSAWQHFSGPNYDPVCLYAATKQSCEAFLTYYAAERNISSISLKLFHAYGPDDPRMRLLTALCRAALTGEPLPMSQGFQIVDYVHVDDVVEAVICADQRLQSGESRGALSYAIPSGRQLTVRDLVRIVETVAGRRINAQWGELPYKSREIMKPVSAGPILPGWAAKVSLECGIAALLRELRQAT
jgi:nucleoside-diphosphate-sugar epimerase